MRLRRHLHCPLCAGDLCRGLRGGRGARPARSLRLAERREILSPPAKPGPHQLAARALDGAAAYWGGRQCRRAFSRRRNLPMATAGLGRPSDAAPDPKHCSSGSATTQNYGPFLSASVVRSPGRGDIRLGRRNAEELGLGDDEFRSTELILGSHLSGTELTLFLDLITDEVVAFEVDPEVGRASLKRTGQRLDRDAMRAGPQVEHPVADRRICQARNGITAAANRAG